MANDNSPGDFRLIVSDDLHMVDAGKRYGSETGLHIVYWLPSIVCWLPSIR